MATKNSRPTTPQKMDLVAVAKVPRRLRDELKTVAAEQDRPIARVLRAAITNYVAEHRKVSA